MRKKQIKPIDYVRMEIENCFECGDPPSRLRKIFVCQIMRVATFKTGTFHFGLTLYEDAP